MAEPEILTQAWREQHVRDGDDALRVARRILEETSGQPGNQVLILGQQAAGAAATAQAHYAAANVRARPTGPAELRTKMPYVIPGVEGVWEIRGMSTEDFGARGNVELRLYRVEGS